MVRNPSANFIFYKWNKNYDYNFHLFSKLKKKQKKLYLKTFGDKVALYLVECITSGERYSSGWIFWPPQVNENIFMCFRNEECKFGGYQRVTLAIVLISSL